MAIRLGSGARAAMVDALLATMDAGSGPATLDLYTGSQPADADTSASGTLLATLTLNDPVGISSAGVLTFDVDPPVVGTAVADGDAGWARLSDSDGNAILDGSVGESDADFVVDSVTVTTGEAVALVSTSTLTLPAS